MKYGEVRLRRGEQRNLITGLTWVYDNQVAWVDDACQDGGLAEVYGSDRTYYGRGFFNSKSKIVVRLLTRGREEIDDNFIAGRIAAAWKSRESLGFSHACRVVFGEADGLPGLTVDKYGDYLSYQIVSAGMERFQDVVVSTLIRLFSPKGICCRGDLAARQKEGLPMESGCVYGTVPEKVPFLEGRAKMTANLMDGQKTGHFLDQQENRLRLKPYCDGKKVLDLCCHTGGFSIHAALFGADSVHSVDASASALAMLMDNAALNGVEGKITPICSDVFDYLTARAKEGSTYDVIICDPPAFAKSRKALDAAVRGYRQLNRACMALLPPGGLLFTFSCSQFMTPPLFLQTVREAAAEAGRQVQMLETFMQSRDHPVSFCTESSWYLKGYLLRIL